MYTHKQYEIVKVLININLLMTYWQTYKHNTIFNGNIHNGNEDIFQVNMQKPLFDND